VAMRRSVIVPSSASMHRRRSRWCRSTSMITLAVGLPVVRPVARR
jgi:hypothetical protein